MLTRITLFIAIVISTTTAAQKNISLAPVPIHECGKEYLIENMGQRSMNVCAQKFVCDDPFTRDEYIYDPSQPMKVIRTIAKVVRDDNGLNPEASERDIAMEYHHLNKNFAPYGFQFTYKLEYVDDSDMKVIDTQQETGLLFFNYATETDSHCNVFFTRNGVINSSFAMFPWEVTEDGTPIAHLGVFMNTIAQVYPWNMRSTFVHEMGHMMGLEHPFFGSAETPDCDDDCAENMLSMGDDVGDWCSDTPPQDRSWAPSFEQTSDCNEIPFDTIPHTNYMSYSDNKLVFTPQQVARMHCYMESHPSRNVWLDYSDPEIPYIYADAFGYEFTEDENIDTSEWIDVSSSGTEAQGLLDDNVVGPFDLGFEANFYGKNFNQIYIGSNGYISLAPININSTSAMFPNIPSIDTNNDFFALFMTDLNFTGTGNPGKVYFYSNELDTFIVTFKNAPFYTGSTTTGYTGNNTFQMIYTMDSEHPNGIIKFQYLNMDYYYPVEMLFSPNPSIIGIENNNGSIGLEVNNFRMPNDLSAVTITKMEQISSIYSPHEVNILVYPNPSQNEITIDLGTNYNSLEFQLHNTYGQRVYSTKMAASQKIKIPLNVPDGIYILTISENGKALKSAKIIKRQ